MTASSAKVAGQGPKKGEIVVFVGRCRARRPAAGGAVVALLALCRDERNHDGEVTIP